jgi:predicted MFS family arabinose efflux permease
VVNFAGVSVLMLGPLLVALAHAFQTSVAMVGQLSGATAITWGITAPLAGPVSDVYGQRPMLLTGLLLLALGLLGAVLAWDYQALLALRLLTGVGAALIPPNSLAIVSEVFLPTERGKAIGWLISASGLSAMAGVPLVVALLAVGGWHLPFLVLGTASLSVGLLCWVWLPQRSRPPGHALAFFAYYREAGTQGMFWWVLIANALEQMAFFGLVSYLAAHLMQSYHMPAGDTALPLALVGGGVVVGGVLGGGRGPSLSLTVLRPVVRGQWAAHGRRLHGGDVAVDSGGVGLWRGQSRPHLVGGGPDRVTRTGGRVTDDRHRIIRVEQPTGRVWRHLPGRPDAGAGRVSPRGPLLS